LNICEFPKAAVHFCFKIDEGYPEYETRQDSQHQKKIQKISVMQDRFQLKVNKVESTVETGDSSVPVYYQTQKNDDLFELITEFLSFHEVSAMCFSELIRGRSAVFAAKAFTNLLGMFFFYCYFIFFSIFLLYKLT
ncbi:unnamed protein product, partial [Onchocerca flexuosa]|uniref:RWD domain-containing protein n=1 Tax=Onchocerca flexuosa TaxID=387005 RepID=A0A183HD82_9BILA